MSTTCNENAVYLRNLVAPCYYQLHKDIKERKYQFINLPGGRGSAKSTFVAIEIILNMMKDTSGTQNAIVFRAVAGTLRESVFSQLQWAIDSLGVSHLWKSNIVPLGYEYKPTGAQIMFRGLDKADKLKSVKPKKGYFAFIWFEEFSEISGELLLRSVQQSVMRGGKDFIVFRSFNPPISKNNWANVYIQQPNPQAITVLTDYTMIPPEWLGEAFIIEAQRLKEINETAYRHEYLGEAVGTGGEVFPNLDIRTIEDDEIQHLDYIFHGIDFGFAVDPACFLRVAYDQKHETIYLLDEIYGRGIGNEELAEEIKARGYDNLYVTCDCAEPKSITDLRDMGILSKACYKRAGCVNYRVKWLQHRTIVIDPKRTPNAHRELVNYSYPVDKNGNLESTLVDKENHSIDALAYALDREIYRRGEVA